MEVKGTVHAKTTGTTCAGRITTTLCSAYGQKANAREDQPARTAGLGTKELMLQARSGVARWGVYV